jgi:hypothetical protein
MQSPPSLDLTIHERCTLAAWASAPAPLDPAASKRALRASIVLATADGLDPPAIAARLGVRTSTAIKWLQRFVQGRLVGLDDRPRSGAPRRIANERIVDLVQLTIEPTPQGARRWSRRMMADATGLSRSTVHRIWRKFDIAPDGSTPREVAAHPLLTTPSPSPPHFPAP